MTKKAANLNGPGSSLWGVSGRCIAEPIEVLELENRLKIRSDICGCLIKALRFSIACCFGLVILQGFHPWGFKMDAALLKYLCGATIVQSGALLAVFANSVWHKTEKEASASKCLQSGLREKHSQRPGMELSCTKARPPSRARMLIASP
jgi:hypothetical protein